MSTISIETLFVPNVKENMDKPNLALEERLALCYKNDVKFLTSTDFKWCTKHET
jgi:hypothetical protein